MFVPPHTEEFYLLYVHIIVTRVYGFWRVTCCGKYRSCKVEDEGGNDDDDVVVLRVTRNAR